MEGRVMKNKQASPERVRIRRDRSPKHQNFQKIQVVYYLSRNRQLEHPHCVDVPISSPEGLYLRDVVERLNLLRGRGMASSYSWSCKRNHKSGFVWHDLCEDDLILPAHGNEYVLKGSELYPQQCSGRLSPIASTKTQHLKMLPEPVSRPRDESTSSSSMSGKDGNSNHDTDEGVHKLVSPASCLGFSEVGNISSRRGAATDASTQTDIGMPSPPHPSRDIHPHSTSTSTLESLIKVDATAKTSNENTRGVEAESGGGGCGNGEEAKLQWRPKAKGGGNALMQLFSCGSISVKDSGLFPTYRPRSSHSKFPSPLMMFGELDCLSRSHGLIQLKMEDKEYFSGSLIETRTHNGDADSNAVLKRCSSYNAERTCKEEEEEKVEREDKEEKGGMGTSSGMSKCIPRSIKVSLSKQNPRSDSMRSPVSDPPRSSLDGDGHRATVCSKRTDSFGENMAYFRISFNSKTWEIEFETFRSNQASFHHVYKG